MRFLVDSSVWLEVLLDQSNAAEGRAFLSATSPADYAISRFALHSIGVVLVRRGAGDLYAPFVADIVLRHAVAVLDLPLAMLPEVIATGASLDLDFDDAFQYLVAEREGLTLVSFDAHFDRTPRGRKAPAAAMPANP